MQGKSKRVAQAIVVATVSAALVLSGYVWGAQGWQAALAPIGILVAILAGIGLLFYFLGDDAPVVPF